MELNNINLWFAKNDNGEIVTIDKLSDEYEGKYYCPLCGSEIIPKALNSKKVSPHFAHINRESCSGESIVHYWVKNQLIKKDDVFEVITNESIQHMCKEILLEQSYETPYGVYRPDITIVTYKDEKIFIEVNYTNKKKVEDYYSKWKYLENTVIEFSVKNIYGEVDNKIVISNSFKAIYYKGMNFNINKNNSDYISYRKGIRISEFYEKKLREIEWFIDDVYRYILGVNKDILELTNNFMELAKSTDNHEILKVLYKNNKCQHVIKEILEYRDEATKFVLDNIKIPQNAKTKHSENSQERLIIDKIKNNSITITYDIELEDRSRYEDFKSLSKDYNYFNNLFERDGDDVKLSKTFGSWWEDNNLVVKFKIKVNICDISDKNRYIKEIKECIYDIDFINEKIKDIIETKDYIIYSESEKNEDYIKDMIRDVFIKNDNAISVLIRNNVAFNNIVAFLKNNIDRKKYSSTICSSLELVDFNDYLYKEKGVDKLDIERCCSDIIEKFEVLYKEVEIEQNLIQAEIDICKKAGMEEYYGDVYTFLDGKRFQEKIISNLKDDNLFVNYDEYPYKESLIANIKRMMQDLIKCDVEKYIKEIDGKTFINKNHKDYYNLLIKDEQIYSLSRKTETMHQILTGLNRICFEYGDLSDFRIYNINSYLLNEYYEIVFKINRIEVMVKSSGIYLNDIKMVKINNMFDYFEILEKIRFMIDMITKQDRYYADENIINIYNKIVYKYKKVTNRKYSIKIIDKSINEIIIDINYIGTFKISKNTIYEEISDEISIAVRKYLYGGN